MLTDNIPDFDSMTPEEIQAWMETLAERQGATEGFTTETRVEVAEIDPTTVDIQDNYVPYGKTAEEWARIQEEERAARQTVKPPSPPPTPEPVTPVSATPSAGTSSDGMPDFDSMTPEQLQAWMETLAERQGATEGFTTETRMEVQEIDPTTVDIQDNYVPYGKTAEEWARIQEEERVARQAKSQPVVPEAQPNEMDWLSELATPVEDSKPELEMVDLSALGLDLNTPDTPDALPDIESLDFSGLDDIDLDFNLDDLELGGLAESVGDPMEWLDGLMNDEDSSSASPTSQPALELPHFDDDDGSTDTLEWLNTLAAQAEELPKSDALAFDDPNDWLNELAEEDPANADVSTESVMQDLKRGISDPDTMKAWMDNMLELGASRDDVTDYDEEEEPEQLAPEIPDWLLEMENLPDNLKTDSVPAVSDDQFINDLGLDTLDEPDMGDWLSGEYGDVEAEADFSFQAQQPTEQSSEDWLAGQSTANIPDWLLDDTPDGTDDIEAIFARPDLIDEDGLDQTDSWVEAFELERQMRARGLEDIPEAWLEGDLPKVDTSVIRESVITGQVILQEAILPDHEDWEEGELESVPSWMNIQSASTVEDDEHSQAVMAQPEATADETDFPDWLKIEADETETVPDWLSDSGVKDIEAVPDWLLMDTGMLDPRVVGEDVILDPTPEPEKAVVLPEPVAKSQPARQPAITLGDIDPRAFLQAAREKLQQGAIHESLQDYEAVVKVNQEVEVVVEDLSKLVKEGPHKHNPAVHRVLGDGLMRQGKLQEALDTYRKALNLL